jgi:hypothetical protein
MSAGDMRTLLTHLRTHITRQDENEAQTPELLFLAYCRQERELEVEAMEDRITKPPKVAVKESLDPKLVRSLKKHLTNLAQGVAILEDKVRDFQYLGLVGMYDVGRM